MKKTVSAIAACIAIGCGHMAYADSGSQGVLAPDTWEQITVNRCMLFPWSHVNSNRVTLLVYPEPFSANHFLWTTDDATITFLTPYCAYDHTEFWVIAPQGTDWVIGVHPIAIGSPPQ